MKVEFDTLEEHGCISADCLIDLLGEDALMTKRNGWIERCGVPCDEGFAVKRFAVKGGF